MSARGNAGKVPNFLRKVKKESEKEGWTWEKKTNHYQVYKPDGEHVIAFSTTMYEGPLTKRILSVLRKAGCPGA